EDHPGTRRNAHRNAELLCAQLDRYRQHWRCHPSPGLRSTLVLTGRAARFRIERRKPSRQFTGTSFAGLETKGLDCLRLWRRMGCLSSGHRSQVISRAASMRWNRDLGDRSPPTAVNASSPSSTKQPSPSSTWIPAKSSPPTPSTPTTATGAPHKRTRADGPPPSNSDQSRESGETYVATHHNGGGWGIRTPESFHSTRFPSVRHRPLGESSWRAVTRVQKRPKRILRHPRHRVCAAGLPRHASTSAPAGTEASRIREAAVRPVDLRLVVIQLQGGHRWQPHSVKRRRLP
ncbi:MAG: hypothetical protein JWQ64_1355, partial [Subtercola sp.]|nr:hypothetical protein [Subtercola sp.]